MRIFLGMITKRLDATTGLAAFAENAEKYGHKLTKAVATCSKGYDETVYKAVRQKIPFEVIDVNDLSYYEAQLARHGVTRKTRQALLVPPFEHESGMLPYGFNRNLVLIDAILSHADVLVFIDSDVIPYVLVHRDGRCSLDDIDFFGRHLEYLNAGTMVTISEYSGYNILPKAQFSGMDPLLLGLQKGDMIPFWRSSPTHHCLAVQDYAERPSPGKKVLGGNSGFRMEVFSRLPPFFSSFYMAGDVPYLARGEDTVLTPALERNNISCIDIKTKIFHDTYANYPTVPDLRTDPDVQRRFYYACTGWIGRNPFFNYILGNDIRQTREYQGENLRRGAQALSAYTENPQYLTLPEKFEISWGSLDRYIGEYGRLLEAWFEFTSKCMTGGQAS